MEEVWIDIVGFIGKYQISNYGRVKSIKRKYAGEKILKLQIDKDGYHRVSLKNGKSYYLPVHRLVAQAFIPNPDNLPCVNHKDENKLNNFVWINDDGTVDLEKSNLEWCTVAYNNTYGSRYNLNEKPVLQFDLNGNLINKYKSVSDAARINNYKIQAIQGVCCGYKSKKNSVWF